MDVCLLAGAQLLLHCFSPLMQPLHVSLATCYTRLSKAGPCRALLPRAGKNARPSSWHTGCPRSWRQTPSSCLRCNTLTAAGSACAPAGSNPSTAVIHSSLLGILKAVLFSASVCHVHDKLLLVLKQARTWRSTNQGLLLTQLCCAARRGGRDGLASAAGRERGPVQPPVEAPGGGHV